MKEKRKILDIELGLEPAESPPEHAVASKGQISIKGEKNLNSNPKRVVNINPETVKRQPVG